VNSSWNLAIEDVGQLTLHESPLRPACPASQRLLKWVGVNTPPPQALPHPLFNYLLQLGSAASLSDPSSYGSALRKFHLFCDIFSIPERLRLPASFDLLHSFALWAVAIPDPSVPVFADGTVFEPVSVRTARSYLAGVRAWHIAQGWPAPLRQEELDRINFSLRGLERAQQTRSRPPRPPITINMLLALRLSLNHHDSFDCCVWAVATCAFFGLMRLGEVTVHSRQSWNIIKHLARCDMTVDRDPHNKPIVKLSLPSAKTAKPGMRQCIYLVEQRSTCPLQALSQLFTTVPASPFDPLFSWRDHDNRVRPMTRRAFMSRVNTILQAWGWGTAFGHSFRIGGASFYLASGVSPETVRLAGRWKSIAFDTYIRSFGLVAARQLSNRAWR
jgi:hypothetical protein